VAHAAWQSPDGRHGVVLANWTTEDRSVTVSDARLGKKVVAHIYGRQVETTDGTVTESGIKVNLPPLSCGLVTNP
jgi:hypothetical protein